jgi:hypothetical protein
VDGYIEEALEEAPLADRRVVQDLDALAVQDQLTLLRQTLDSETEVRKQSEVKVAKMASEMQALCKDVEVQLRSEWEEMLRPPAVLNVCTFKVHATRPGSFTGPMMSWVTPCGWQWVKSGPLARTLSSEAELCDTIAQPSASLMTMYTMCQKCSHHLPLSWMESLRLDQHGLGR